MKCGFCQTEGVDVAHVKGCAHNRGIPTQETAATEEAPRLRPVRPSEERREAARQDLFRQVRALAATIDEGHYAVMGSDGKLHFYRVSKGKAGTRWEGRTFLEVQASDEFHRLLGGLKTELSVYTRIAANPQEAMLTYGQKIGRCGHCHRTLTDAESRERGIGPVCARKLGWEGIAV